YGRRLVCRVHVVPRLDRHVLHGLDGRLVVGKLDHFLAKLGGHRGNGLWIRSSRPHAGGIRVVCVKYPVSSIDGFIPWFFQHRSWLSACIVCDERCHLGVVSLESLAAEDVLCSTLGRRGGTRGPNHVPNTYASVAQTSRTGSGESSI